MSLIGEQIQELRNLAEDAKCKNEEDDIVRALQVAADTIETLSAKLASANMERSSAYYNNEDDLDDAMIRASRKAKIITNDLVDIYNQKGLIYIYNLGLKNMYEYLTKLKQ